MLSVHVLLIVLVYGLVTLLAKEVLCSEDTSHSQTSSRDHDPTELKIQMLYAQQNWTNLEQSRQNTKMHSVVTEQFPWMFHKNSLPFFFNGNDFVTNEKYQSLRTSYSGGVMIFLDTLSGERNTIRYCMENIAVKNNEQLSLVTSGEKKEHWDQANSPNNNYRNKYSLHWGMYTFGMCSNIDRPCSYFSIFTDPLQSSVRRYNYCKESTKDPLCVVVNANQVTLREWILLTGSTLFYQLTQKPGICSKDVDIAKPRHKSALPKNTATSATERPCWYRQKLFVDSLSSVDTHYLLDFVLYNLEKWFAVIGLESDANLSQSAFKYVYGEPFRDCIDKSKTSFNSEHNTSNNINPSDNNRANRNKNRSPELDFYDENNPENLKDDWAVKKALDADYKIYREAKRLFSIQKQILSNRVR